MSKLDLAERHLSGATPVYAMREEIDYLIRIARIAEAVHREINESRGTVSATMALRWAMLLSWALEDVDNEVIRRAALAAQQGGS